MRCASRRITAAVALIAVSAFVGVARAEPVQVAADGRTVALPSRWELDNWNGHCEATLVQAVRVGRDGVASGVLVERASAYVLARAGDRSVFGCGGPTRRTAWRRRSAALGLTPRAAVRGGELTRSQTLVIGDVSVRARRAGATVQLRASTAIGVSHRTIALPDESDLSPSHAVQALVVGGYAYVQVRWTTGPGKVAITDDRWFAIKLR